MVPRRRAARDLQVDHTVADPVAAQHFAGHEFERAARKRQIHPQLSERALKPVQVRLMVDHSTAEDGGNFVDPVRELVAPVLDVDVRKVVAEVAAVHIGDTRHVASGQKNSGLTANICSIFFTARAAASITTRSCS